MGRMTGLAGHGAESNGYFIVGHGQMILNVRGVVSFRQPGEQKVLEMLVVDPSHAVEIQLRKHKISGKEERLRGMNPPHFDAKHRLTAVVLVVVNRQNPQGIDKAIMVEFAVGNATVMGVPQEVIHPVNTKGITGYYFSEDGLPG